ncbi:MAG TPA: class I SAM-dependent methyltransferase [Verrucomicrobiae bacterium]|nr:class I SAM-dependent methyltransferase [Verrucomicrobiae bacterium]
MSFDRLAPYYRWLELVTAGKKLHRCRTAFLAEIPAPTNILLAGEGHGRSLAEYRRRFPRAQITCLDASPAILAQARRQLERLRLPSADIRFIQADALNWRPEGGPFDLIVTNFFLDCFRRDQLESLIPRLAAAGTPGAHWLVADFQVAPAGWKRLRSRLILWSLYRFFRLVTRLPADRLTPPAPLLERAGFILHRRLSFEGNLLHGDWWIRPSGGRIN